MEFVIARYNENLNWLDNLLDPEQMKKVTVYNKGPDNVPGSIRLPNIGREAHTYLTHIINNYETLAEKVYFLQGNPVDHFLFYGIQPTFYHFQKFLTLNENGKTSNFQRHEISYGHRENRKCVQKSGMCLGEWFEKVFGIKYPNNVIVSYGACFGVTREKIRARTKEFYIELNKSLDTIDPEIAYFLERAWYYIFT